MSFAAPLPLLSLVRFWWDAAGYLAGAARARLGLFPVPAKPFLPRREHADLAGLLDFLEPVLRRVFYLLAAEQGALAPRIAAPARPAGLTAAPGRARDTSPAPRVPHLRLTEPVPAPRPGAAAARPRIFRTGPRIRFLDTAQPVDLRDWPAGPDDLLPAARLVRRLRAVNHALDNPEHYVLRMRRLLGQARPVLRARAPAAFHARRLKHLQQESARELHAATGQVRLPDTS